MLCKETVEPATLDLILRLQSDSLFEKFFLVGGTSLSLQIGHRKSIDIDLFSQEPFDHVVFSDYLEHKFSFSVQYMHTNTLKGIINGIFVDFITHNYPYVSAPIQIEGINMLGKSDIAAMKINAISGNGTRLKDFIDIYFLLKEYDFGQLIGFYKKKYGNRNEFHALKSLTYFEDINKDDWPEMILEPKLKFAKLKKEIILKRDLFLNNL
ncbi:MAG: nucleotidyl transferase AbiEii/AbiGii toxin family protein [Bacteroidales bacterium]